MRTTTRMLTASVLIGLAVAALLSGAATQLLMIGYAICIAVVWATGIRALVLWGRSHQRQSVAEDTCIPLGRIALLYCTCDDLDVTALAASAGQDVAVDVFVLDDSHPSQYEQVNAAAEQIGATVLRRADRSGAKAGNINHALTQLPADVSAVVILDSDTVLPQDFVRRAWAALTADPSTACVQAVPVADGVSWFARFFGPLVRSHSRVNHATRARIGFPAFIGRGAMIKTIALRDVGGVPLAVSEDLALSVRLRERGWQILHSTDIEFHEDFPIDYAAFRVQQAKAAEGAAEFLRNSSRQGVQVLRIAERLDLQLETALLSLGAAAGLGALASGTALALRGVHTPALVTLITGVLALAPLLPEATRRIRAGAAGSAVTFLVLAPLLYSSVALLILRHALAVRGGRTATFIVTPKHAGVVALRGAIETMRAEWAWGIVAVVAALCLGTLPVAAPFAIPAVFGTTLLLWGARPGGIRGPALSQPNRSNADGRSHTTPPRLHTDL